MSEQSYTSNRLYRSELSDTPLTLGRARIAIVAPEERSVRQPFGGSVVRADMSKPEVHEAVKAINMFFWAELTQDVFGRTYEVLDCDSFLAYPSGDEIEDLEEWNKGIAGQIAVIEEKEGFLHIIVFHVWPNWQGRGVGTALLNAARSEALKLGLKTIKLGTTNDNIPALYFYQRSGFVIDEIVRAEQVEHHVWASTGFAGIAIRDEIRMRLDLKD
jgi:GNAT superfamily N-acetyltransferase